MTLDKEEKRKEPNQEDIKLILKLFNSKLCFILNYYMFV